MTDISRDAVERVIAQLNGHRVSSIEKGFHASSLYAQSSIDMLDALLSRVEELEARPAPHASREANSQPWCKDCDENVMLCDLGRCLACGSADLIHVTTPAPSAQPDPYPETEKLRGMIGDLLRLVVQPHLHSRRRDEIVKRTTAELGLPDDMAQPEPDPVKAAARVLLNDDIALRKMAAAMHDGPLMADDHWFSASTPAGAWCLDMARAALRSLSEGGG
ncbi:hypothetical protein [Ruegeria sp. EL01]|jgi:hypothetical protein|uniref:hypothetical protein n=1 Tax=Ruegeria sp. EL01 TaxID=2107578 RepID=UPI000EA80B6B|nr:hypothetical protein [Ruegeria sp. EL01]